MKNKKNIFILIILICIFVATFIFEKQDIKIELIEFSINQELTKLINGYDVEILDIEDELIYGQIYNTNTKSDLFETIGIFSYNEKKHDFGFYEYNQKNRILDYIIKDEYIYYIKISEIKNEYIWKFCINNLKFENEKEILSGHIFKLSDFPKILKYNDNIYFLSIDSIGENNTYVFYKISTHTYEKIYETTGDVRKKIGNYIYNTYDIRIIDDELLYTYVNSDNNQCLNSINLSDYTIHDIYCSDKLNMILYSYVRIDDKYYIQLVNKENNIANILLIQNDIQKEITKSSDLKTFWNVSHNNIIFHNEGNVWEILNLNNNKISKFNIEKDDIYPKYYIYKDEILVKDFDNNFYISKNLHKIINGGG